MDKKKLIGVVLAAIVIIAGMLLGVDVKEVVCSVPAVQDSVK